MQVRRYGLKLPLKCLLGHLDLSGPIVDASWTHSLCPYGCFCHLHTILTPPHCPPAPYLHWPELAHTRKNTLKIPGIQPADS